MQAPEASRLGVVPDRGVAARQNPKLLACVGDAEQTLHLSRALGDREALPAPVCQPLRAQNRPQTARIEESELLEVEQDARCADDLGLLECAVEQRRVRQVEFTGERDDRSVATDAHRRT